MPTGIFLIKWDEVIGGTVYMRFPETLEIPDPIVQQITITHNFTESHIITEEKGWNSISYYNENKEIIIVLVLRPSSLDDGNDYKDLLEKFNEELNIETSDENLRNHLETLFKDSLDAFRTTDAVITKLSNDVAYLRTKEYDIQERFRKVQESNQLSVKGKILFLLATSDSDGLSLDVIKESIDTSTKWLNTVLETLMKNNVIGYSSNQDVYYIKI
ncbi:MAG: hypothetical protein ACW986_04450 [Promethearchaeota archaeon]|jgi:hypothetical protein